MPAALMWARERSGYDLSSASRKLGIEIDRLTAMETTEALLSPALIRKVADLYRVSAAAFFMSEPPTEAFRAPRDFRTLPHGRARGFSPELRKEIDRVRSQVAHMRELQALGIVSPAVAMLRIDRGGLVESEALHVRAWCEDGSPPGASVLRDRRAHLSWWVRAIERKGILVAQVSRVSLEEMRGLCLSDEAFPAIVLNGADTVNGRLFTLLHELVHVLLGVDGIINGFQSQDSTEIFCNAIAAAVLVPRERLLALASLRHATSESYWALPELESVAHDFGVSREVVLRRLLTVGKVSRSCFDEQQAALRAEYDQRKDVTSEREGGPAYDVMLLRNLGRYYASAVLKARARGVISEIGASDFLFSKSRWTDALELRLAREGDM